MNKDEIIKQFDGKITEIANQDAVRAETLKREIADGTIDDVVENIVVESGKMYVEAINQGFSDDQAFAMALKFAGLDS
ncbi:hypothetical protein [Lactiplantibacillus paraxiangfangensis]|uniref:hypothetical protein n=1 Tax=Lactiplantibacillus paraxiangfangensis TaxID=3076224 RepID=UPI0030C70787